MEGNETAENEQCGKEGKKEEKNGRVGWMDGRMKMKKNND